MKAIIPVAGAGTRLRPLTYTQPKPLIPVAGKPILSFIIDPLIEQGVTEYLIILGYLGDKIKAFVEENTLIFLFLIFIRKSDLAQLMLCGLEDTFLMMPMK